MAINSPHPELIRKFTWSDVRAEVSLVNPGLAQMIDGLPLTKEHTLYKLNCPWGQHLLLEGTLYLPNENQEWVPIYDPSINPKIQKDLGYNNNIPLGMSLKNCAELYINALGRIIPFVFFEEGKIFGMWLSLEYDANKTCHSGWTGSIIAGSRSLKLLPKITDAKGFKQLKKSLALDTLLPDNYTDQWTLLSELAIHPAFPEPWHLEVLYFSAKWLEPSEDIAWKLFKNYLLEIAWSKTAYLRNQFIFDVAFSCALEEKNLRPNPYLTDTAKHLYALVQGNYPGYVIANNSNALPLKGFQQVFNEIYGLRYAPIIMQPGYISTSPGTSIYYSLETPTLMAFSPRSRKTSNRLEDLREVKHIMERSRHYLLEDKLRLKNTPLYHLAKEIHFDYYHTDLDPYGAIKHTETLPLVDSVLAKQLAQFQDRPFCETSPFLRGCIRASK